MEYQFTWKTKMFSKSFLIFCNETEAGEIKKENWSRKVNGRLNDTEILFQTKGFFRPETNIIRRKDGFAAGRIIYHRWKNKATLFYEEREYNWQFDSFFGTRWSLGHKDGIIVRFHSHGFKGDINSSTRNEILILATFFIRNYMKQRTAEIAAAT